MNIAILSDDFCPPWNEGYRQLKRNLVGYLIEKGDNAVVLSSSEIHKDRFLPKILGQLPLIRKLETILLAKRLFKRKGIEAIIRFVSANRSVIIEAYLWEKILGIPYYLYVTSVSKEKRFYSFFPPKKNILVGGDYLKRFFPKSHVLYPYVDLDVLSRNHKSSNKRKTRTILFLGAFQKERGVQYLVEAIARLKSRLNIKLLLAWNGRGNLENEIRTQIREQGIEEITTIVGNTDISELYNKADIVVIPRVINPKLETKMYFPLRIIEALFFQKPLIVSDVYGWGSIIKGCGIAVTPGSAEELKKAIMKLVSDSDYFESCADTCLKKLDMYHPKRSLRETYEILHGINSKK